MTFTLSAHERPTVERLKSLQEAAVDRTGREVFLDALADLAEDLTSRRIIGGTYTSENRATEERESGITLKFAEHIPAFELKEMVKKLGDILTNPGCRPVSLQGGQSAIVIPFLEESQSLV